MIVGVGRKETEGDLDPRSMEAADTSLIEALPSGLDTRTDTVDTLLLGPGSGR